MHTRYTLFVFILVFSLLLAACGGGALEPAPAEGSEAEAAMEEEAPAEEMEMESEAESEAEDVEAAGDAVVVRWFVGLGTGQNAEQVAAQEAVVEAFNASHDEIELQLEIVQNDVAYDTLATAIASGDAPDIVGPVGVRGSNAFTGNWMDLQPLVDEHGYDLSQFPEAAVDFYRVEGQGLIGLPFATFPSFIFYNRALFDEAGLEYPPHEFGEPYADGDEWTAAKMTELAKELTVDANGYIPTEGEFDPEAIEQFGFIHQWTDARGAATLFGAGSFVDAEGNAYAPEHWREAYHWIHNGIWGEEPFYPSQAYQDSELLATPNAFASGNVAMASTHLWFTCCLQEMADEWDIAVHPSYEGETTAKLHADTFRMLDTTENPDEAFVVLTYLIDEAANDLLQVYGGMPARLDETDEFFAGLDETYPFDVDWEVAKKSLSYPDNPSHESNMPNFNRADDRVAAFWSLLLTDGGVEVDEEVDTLVSDLQVIFSEAAEAE